MPLSRRSVDALIDLVENKLSTMQIADREDTRDLVILENARRELVGLRGAGGEVVGLADKPTRRRGANPS